MAPIPIAPSGPPPGSGSPPSGGSSSSGGTSSGSSSKSSSKASSKSSSKGSSGGGGGGGGDPYGYRSKAADRYRRQARNLDAQAKALLRAINSEFDDALKQRLKNVMKVLGQQDSLLLEGYKDRRKSLGGAYRDNEIAEGAQTNAARSNMVRERNSAVSEAMMQGSGESDLLAAQQMSLRNWNANQNEVNRSLFDTLRSVNSSLTDLNVDTKTGRENLYSQANADKDLLWTNYYNQKSDAYTQLGNIRGQQADLFASAAEYGGKYAGGGHAKKAEQAFMQAAKISGEAWENPGVPKWVRKWEGRDEFNSTNNMSRMTNLQSVRLDKKPEGATLREWTT